METKTVDLDGVKVTISRMTPLSYTEHQSIIAAGAHGGEQGHDESGEFWTNKKLHTFVQNVLLPETVLSVINPAGKVYERKGRRPCVGTDGTDGTYCLNDMGFTRFWNLAGEIIRFTAEPDATFRAGDEATGDRAGADLEAGEVHRRPPINVAQG